MGRKGEKAADGTASKHFTSYASASAFPSHSPPPQPPRSLPLSPSTQPLNRLRTNAVGGRGHDDDLALEAERLGRLGGSHFFKQRKHKVGRDADTQEGAGGRTAHGVPPFCTRWTGRGWGEGHRSRLLLDLGCKVELEIPNVGDLVLDQKRHVLGEGQADLAGQRRRLGEKVEVAQRERERDRLLQLDDDRVVLLKAGPAKQPKT